MSMDVHEDLAARIVSVVNHHINKGGEAPDVYRVAQLSAMPLDATWVLGTVAVGFTDGRDQWELAIVRTSDHYAMIQARSANATEHHVATLDLREYTSAVDPDALEARMAEARVWVTTLEARESFVVSALAPVTTMLVAMLVMLLAACGGSTALRNGGDGASDGQSDGASLVDGSDVASLTADNDELDASVTVDATVGADVVLVLDATDPPPDVFVMGLPPYYECDPRWPCIGGSDCVSGVCENPCTTPADCPAAPTDPEGNPTARIVCAQGRCRLACTIETNCPGAQECTAGVCQ